MVESTICFKVLQAVDCNLEIRKIKDHITAFSLSLSRVHKASLYEVLELLDNRLYRGDEKESIDWYKSSTIKKLFCDHVFQLKKDEIDVLERELINGTLLNFLNTNGILPSNVSQLLLDRVVCSSLEAVLEAG